VRALRFRLDRHRDRWTAARGTLRAILAAYLRRAPVSLSLGADANGKPYLEHRDGPAPLRFNLAHADGMALIALGWRREVGVGVEREVPERAGRRRDYRDAHPEGAALLVEVALSSLAFDRRHKGSLYARAGVADYWIVNLVVASSKCDAGRRPI
jgi:phosphopantetheinyl transferase